VAQGDEEGKIHGPEGHELGVAAGHAVALAVHARGAFLADQTLETKVDGFAEELAGEHEEDFDFAGGYEERGVGDHEGLGDKGEEGGEVGDGIGGILD